jgi:hypothetical protein
MNKLNKFHKGRVLPRDENDKSLIPWYCSLRDYNYSEMTKATRLKLLEPAKKALEEIKNKKKHEEKKVKIDNKGENHNKKQ